MSGGRISDIKIPKVKVVVIAALLLFSGWLFYMEIFSCNILSEHGLYTIATVNEVKTQTGRGGSLSGRKAYFTYSMNGKRYSGTDSNHSFNGSMVGKRFFVLVAPGRTRKTILLHDNPVPDWFTAPVPAGGWEKLPSQGDLRQMMCLP